MMYAMIDQATGEILRMNGMPPGVLVPEGVSDETHYWFGGQFVSRPVLNVPDRIEMTAGQSLSLSVPMGTRATIMEQAVMCSDGALTLNIDTPDTYTLHMYPPFPYVSQYVELIVT